MATLQILIADQNTSLIDIKGAHSLHTLFLELVRMIKYRVYLGE